MLSPDQFPTPSDFHPSPHSLDLPPLARAFAQRVRDAGGRAVLVGGYVRDLYLGHAPGDLDFEVFGLAPAELERLTRALSPANTVGKDFGIIKMGELDISLPRADREAGRAGFMLGEPRMSLRDASRRRDFTLNAMACDPLTGEVFDCWGGLQDLQNRILTPVAEETFVEDPLRALRAVQFVARFQLQASPLCRSVLQKLAPLLPGLPRERLLEEFNKLFWKGKSLGMALTLAHDTGLIRALIPELETAPYAAPTPAAPHASPWQRAHEALTLAEHRPRTSEEARITILWALLLHPLVDSPPPPDLSHPLRDYPSCLKPVAQVLGRLTDEKRLKSNILGLTLHQQAPDWLHFLNPTDTAVRRLSVRVRLEYLLEFCRCLPLDSLGKPRLSASVHLQALSWLQETATRLDVLTQPPPPLVQGRDLTPLGFQPGPQLGAMLKQIYEWQLDGTITTREEGLARVLLPDETTGTAETAPQ